MAKIKHIAIRTPDPDKTASFYKSVFELEEVGKAGSGVYLSDGYINLAILRSNDNGNGESPRDIPGYAGIDHLGVRGGRRGRRHREARGAWRHRHGSAGSGPSAARRRARLL